MKRVDAYETALVMVRADQVEALLPQLSANSAPKFYVFMHNRASGGRDGPIVQSSLHQQRTMTTPCSATKDLMLFKAQDGAIADVITAA